MGALELLTYDSRRRPIGEGFDEACDIRSLIQLFIGPIVTRLEEIVDAVYSAKTGYGDRLSL